MRLLVIRLVLLVAAASALAYWYILDFRARDCVYCPQMVQIPAGSFDMGAPATEPGSLPNERPVTKVTIPKSLAFSKYDITFAEWDYCVNSGACATRPADQGWGRSTRPVINVSLDDARQYAAWLSSKTGKKYRLPTEAEWEYAARAGTQTAYWWGNEVGKANANCVDCGSQLDNKRTSPVGSLKLNAFGLYDMAGNVLQWVEGCLTKSYEEADKRTEPCERNIGRGGSWDETSQRARSAARYGLLKDAQSYSVGFRVVRED